MTARRATGAIPAPLFCIVTPVFDPALPSLRLLQQSLRDQTCADWVHVLVSNGPSPDVEAWIRAGADPRVRFIALPEVPTPDAKALLCDLGRRRDHALQTAEAQLYLLFDADLQLLRPDLLERLAETYAAGQPDVILVKTELEDGRVLPIHPVFRPGRIDLANYCVSRRMARKVRYPTDFPLWPRYANDFRYYVRLRWAAHRVVRLDLLAARVSGNRRYVRYTERLASEVAARQSRR